MTTEVKVTQADIAFAEMFRRGIGGKYDRDVSRMAHEAAKHRLTERERIVEWLNDHSRCPFGKSPDWYAEAIERGDHEQGEGR